MAAPHGGIIIPVYPAAALPGQPSTSPSQHAPVLNPPFPRRHGEPDYTERPTSEMNGEILPFPEYSESSWEELELERRMKGKSSTKDNSAASISFDNPLCELQNATEMVDVLIGEKRAHWHLHEKLLCAASPFFNAAINSLFREGVEKKVVMQEDDTAVFTLFVQWLYSKQFTTVSSWLLLKAYALGDKLGSAQFRSLAMDKLYALNYSQCTFTVEQILWVFDNTMPESALRKFTTESVGLGICSKTLDLSAEDWEILAPVMSEIMTGLVGVIHYQREQKWTPKPRFDYYDQTF